MTHETGHPNPSGLAWKRVRITLSLAVACCVAAGGIALGYIGNGAAHSVIDGILTRQLMPTLWEVLCSVVLCFGAYEIYKRTPLNLRWLGIVMSIAASLRYVTWRITHTLNFDTTANTVACWLLLGAETYALLMLLLGHFQTAWPTQRRTPRMPHGARWPSVDVYITTYNEDADLVRRTAVGCQAIDYPSKKVFILDDGSRPEMQALAEEVGVGYISRTDNQHAKAGNLNHAMIQTTGEFIAQFDADHVPVRSFLRETVPFFLWDQKLGFVQTPHHFYNLDAFQRNLLVKDKVSNEQDLFFRVIQPGNDRWNAAFFCGSNAVLRRAALESVGGFATETVTEDAHTAIRLHAKKWNSAYLNRNLAGGLAAESFGDICLQRIRWGMGMCRILRVDNPLFMRGLSLAQRLCYLTASAFFLYGFPRQIFFLAPIVFVLFGVSPIDAGIPTVLTYLVPHMLAAILLTSAVSRNVRHTFWSEVFESALAFPMSMATVWSMFTRKRSPFKVTPKNKKSKGLQWNPSAMLPQLVLLGITLISIGIGVAAVSGVEKTGVMLMNLFWCFYNSVILFAAVLVTIDRPQLRKDTRVPCFLPAKVIWSVKAKSIEIEAATLDLSEGGTQLLAHGPLPEQVMLEVKIGTGDEEVQLEAETVRVSGAAHEGCYDISLRFHTLNTHQRHQLLRLMYTDPNRWSHPPEADNSWTSFMKLAGSSYRWARERERPGLRRAHRIPIDRSAIVHADEKHFMARLTNLTQNGAFIEGILPKLKPQTPVELMTTLHSGQSLKLPGHVVRRTHNGIAVAFDEISDQQRSDLLWDLYVASHGLETKQSA